MKICTHRVGDARTIARIHHALEVLNTPFKGASVWRDGGAAGRRLHHRTVRAVIRFRGVATAPADGAHPYRDGEDGEQQAERRHHAEASDTPRALEIPLEEVVQAIREDDENAELHYADQPHALDDEQKRDTLDQAG